MVLLILIVIFFVLGAVLGAFWKWRVWILLAVVAVAACVGSLYVAEFSSVTAIFHDVWSLFWFLLNYGVYFGLVAGSGVLGSLLSLQATRKLARRRESMRSISHKSSP